MKKKNIVAIQITKEKNSYSATVVGLYDVCTIEAKTYQWNH